MPLSQAELVAGPQSKPLSSLRLELPPEPEPEVPDIPDPRLQPEPTAVVAAEKPAPKKKASSKRLAGESRSRRRSKPRRQLRIALIGALLIGGAQWVLSAPLFSRAPAPLLLDVQRQLVQANKAIERVSEPNTAGMIPVLPTSTVATAPEVVRHPTPHPRLTAPSFGGNSRAPAGGAPVIEPAPAPVIPLAAVPAPDSISARIIDSTSHGSPQGIVTTVSGGGTPAAAQAPPRR